jgi:cytochrome P450
MWERFDPTARRIVAAALRDAAARGQRKAGPEHLFAALDEPSAQVVERHHPRVSGGTGALAEGFTDDALAAMRDATQIAGRRAKVMPAHLKVGIGRHLNGAVAADLPAARLDAMRDAAPDRGFARWARNSAALMWLSRIVQLPRFGWHVYVNKSLGHRGYVTNPYPLYRTLREREPVRRDPLAPVWVVTSYEHTLTVLRDPRFNKDPFIAERLPRAAREQLEVSDAAGARSAAESISMLFLDPPDHTRVRSIFTRAFTPRTLEAVRTRIHEICNEQIELMGRSGDTTDLVQTLAYPLPVLVIAELLGFPREDHARLKRWSDEMAAALGFIPSEEDRIRAAKARDEMREYFFAQIVPRLRKSPDNSLVSLLLEMEARGEGLNEDELFSNSVLLLAAGHETTTGLISNGVLALLQHPDQLAALKADPSLLGSTVDELLRYDPPVQWVSRTAGQDMELGGKTIERGELVLASLGAANRDPSIFSDPDRFDIRRKDNKHLAFGSGIHFCLGAALARMEAEVAISTLVSRYPNLQLATSKLHWRKGITFRGLETLPLKLR